MSSRTEPQISAYLHAKGAQLGIPVAGNFELTARCNFNCPMCYVHQQQADPSSELTAEQWIDLGRQAKDCGMIFVLLTGGEPFVRRDFFQIYEAFQRMGLMVSINSNGSLLSGDICRRLLENPPMRMNISLYGSHRDTYTAMCGRDAFDTVLENIRGLKQAGVDVRLNLSITPWNYRDVPEIYHIAQQLQVPVKASAYMYPPARIREDGDSGNRLNPQHAAQCSVNWDLLRFSAEEFVQRARSMLQLCAVEPDTCGADPEEGVGCRAGSTSFWMTWDGTMLPCGMMPGPQTRPLEQGFARAWDLLRQEVRKIPGADECQRCPKRPVCGSCAAVRIAETGAFDRAPRYMCQMTQHMLEQVQQALREGNAAVNAELDRQ